MIRKFILKSDTREQTLIYYILILLTTVKTIKYKPKQQSDTHFF